MKNPMLLCAAAVVLTLPGCSSRPRQFAPQIASAPVSAAGLEAAQVECRDLLVAGKLDSSGRVASGAVGAAAGGAIAVGGAAAATSAGLYGGMAIASATIVLLPFVALGGAFGMSRIKRGKKEKAIRIAMTGCLKERGYEVTGWAKVDREAAKPAAAVAAGGARR